MMFGWNRNGTRRRPAIRRAVGASFFLAACACAPTPDGNQNDNQPSGPVPVFPANYRETFTEVRDCRFSIEHGGLTIRVLANDLALSGYLNNQTSLPVGGIIVKEEFDGPDCADDSRLRQWRVMRKEAVGFDSEDGDWHWQRVLADRSVVEDAKTSCIGCHRASACVARDYMCTEP